VISGVGTATSGVIALLTDFGTSDGYVGIMKGVILGIHPKATLVDLTHEIQPQDVREAAFVLHTAHRYFPARTVHLAVVDPGVGTARAGVVLDTGDALFVAPDNGLLTYLLAQGRSLPTREGPLRDLNHLVPAPIPPGWKAVSITESGFWLPSPSRTFHGRDIFAPVAAHLSKGQPVDNFGPRLDTLLSFELPVPKRLERGGVEGAVVHVDRFGNLITSIRLEDLPGGRSVVEVAGRYTIDGLRGTYAEGTGLTALVGSSGYLEVALPGGSAGMATGLGVGAVVRVRPTG